MRVERDGDQRWLVVDMPPEKLWPVMRSFWQENGLLVALDNAAPMARRSPSAPIPATAI